MFQSRFLVNGTANKNQTNAPLWIVGLTFTTESRKNFSYARPDVWTNETSNLTVIAAPEDPGWYMFNIQSSGEMGRDDVGGVFAGAREKRRIRFPAQVSTG